MNEIQLRNYILKEFVVWPEPLSSLSSDWDKLLLKLLDMLIDTYKLDKTNKSCCVLEFMGINRDATRRRAIHSVIEGHRNLCSISVADNNYIVVSKDKEFLGEVKKLNSQKAKFTSVLENCFQFVRGRLETSNKKEYFPFVYETKGLSLDFEGEKVKVTWKSFSIEEICYINDGSFMLENELVTKKCVAYRISLKNYNSGNIDHFDTFENKFYLSDLDSNSLYAVEVRMVLGEKYIGLSCPQLYFFSKFTDKNRKLSHSGSSEKLNFTSESYSPLMLASEAYCSYLISNQNKLIEKEIKDESIPEYFPAKESRLITFPVRKVSCGDYFGMFLTLRGEVFAIGSNEHGCLGINAKVSCILDEPKRVEFPEEMFVVDVCAGSRHVIALGLREDKQLLYNWGYSTGKTPIVDNLDTEVNLGLRSIVNKIGISQFPVKVECFENITKIGAGWDLSYILCHQNNRNIPYTFGSALDYRLGYPVDFSDNWTVPRKVEQLENENTVKVFSGPSYTLFLLDSGEVRGVGTGLSNLIEGSFNSEKLVSIPLLAKSDCLIPMEHYAIFSVGTEISKLEANATKLLVKTAEPPIHIYSSESSLTWIN